MSDPFQDNDERFGPEKKTGSRNAWLGAIAVLLLFAIFDVIEYRELAAEGGDRDKLEEMEREVEEMEKRLNMVRQNMNNVASEED